LVIINVIKPLALAKVRSLITSIALETTFAADYQNHLDQLIEQDNKMVGLSIFILNHCAM